MCYRPYKWDLINTKKRLILVEDQCAGHRTDRISEIIGQGIAESHNRVQYINTQEYRN